MLLNLQAYMESHYGKSVINISSILLHLLIPRRYHLLFNKKKKCCHASLYLNGTPADYPYKEIYPTQSMHEQANKAIMQLQIKEENNNV